MISKDLISSMLIQTELSGITEDAYKISPPSTKNSGFTFGQAQWDLSEHNDDTYYNTFISILNQYNASNGNTIFSTDDLENIKEQIIKKDGDISLYKSRINLALQSTNGRQQIDQAYDSYLDA